MWYRWLMGGEGARAAGPGGREGRVGVRDRRDWNGVGDRGALKLRGRWRCEG